MNRYLGDEHYSHDTLDATGVLLVNLGTPDAPTPAALRRYLGEFLSDPRVVELPRAVWLPILHGVILRIRPRRAAHAYRKVWTEEGSPLLAISRRQERALQTIVQDRFPGPVKVALGMRYGNPSIASALEHLRRAQVRRLLVLPLYPQYSGSTGGSTFDAVAETLKTWRWVPELRLLTHYHDHPGYIAALVGSVRDYWQQHGRGDRLLFSFHGLPKRFLLAGDPYHCECHKTGRLVAAALGLPEDRWQVAFQSRFGREEWLKPYTDATLREWAGEGVGRVDVICPGFSADCLETLEEIDIQNRQLFLAAGGQSYHYIPALNDRPEHMIFLADLIEESARGWPETRPDWNRESAQEAAEDARQRAIAKGASG